MSNEIDTLLARAGAERRAQRPYLAYRLYRHAAELCISSGHDPRVESRVYAVALQHALEICREYFSVDADETLEVARELCKLTNDSDGAALVALGTGLSIQSRSTFKSGQPDLAWTQARAAEACLLKATTRFPFDTDAWGTLGGLYKRLAQWSLRANDAVAVERYRVAMLAAYRSGMEQGPDPYPTLNYLELRAVAEPKASIVRDAREQANLERALDVRKHQFARGEDAPWAAFDLARGQHYLRPNVPRLLNDLNVAINDARRVAKRASDRWMVETAVTSLRELYEAQVPLEGLEEALLLARAAVVDDAWVAGNWGPLGRPEDFLAQELRAAREELTGLALQSETLQNKLTGYLSHVEQRWSEADEEEFAKGLDKEVEKFAKDLEPPLKKQARVIWKLFGNDAVGWLVQSAASLVPGAGIAVPWVTKYVKHLLGT